ncbi:hypothetical protein QQP08_026350 [Theobroma cacao]|nr:hypothetical protein QQP08_026350 [Theobroma cacao]
MDDAKRTNDSLTQEVKNLRHKAQLQEVEQERTTKQLKEVMAIAEVETAKCKASHQDTTAQIAGLFCPYKPKQNWAS